MAISAADLEAGLRAAVPFNGTIGVDYVDVGGPRAVLRMPDRPDLHNHVGGPHAGAMFTLGEAASGAVVMAVFGDLLGRATPLAASAEISYRRLAMGPVTATAELGRAREEVVAELDAGATPQFPVTVTLATEDGTVTGEMTVRWALRPQRAT